MLFKKIYGINLRKYLNLKPYKSSSYYYSNLRRVNSVICASGFIKRQLVSHGVRRINVIPYGSKYEFSKPFTQSNQKMANNTPSNKIKIVTICRLTQSKGLHWFFQSFEKLESKIKDRIQWTIISNQIDNEIEELIPKEVLLIKKLKDDKLISYIKESDLLLLPSLYEGFGLVYIEAISLGVPVAYTKNTGAFDFCANKKHGYLLDSNKNLDINFFYTCTSEIEKIKLMRRDCLSLSNKINWNYFRANIVKCCEI
jgi:glycosyltransferase involved in cell wall biosynthesis